MSFQHNTVRSTELELIRLHVSGPLPVRSSIERLDEPFRYRLVKFFEDRDYSLTQGFVSVHPLFVLSADGKALAFFEVRPFGVLSSDRFHELARHLEDLGYCVVRHFDDPT
jgi:hypothetical protein